ncbi:hypothetical protein [Fibrobacter sp. UWB11]|uniref:hypothetical protein n=1 Tax=Fibrobacter sp. UWB11 TaxID=1896202 RepID=UPI000929A7DA|nr:hypothetical protein [Fibrobacter sp. UWB11]SIN84094.1 hypothetical protein SAMN05720758_0182 [Fibrobacter sp. UWB11]
MMKRLLLIVVALASAACAIFGTIPKRAYIEGGTDHFYFNGVQCRILTYPLNEYIARHYAEWPFRPTVNDAGMFFDAPMYMYYKPENGGGYSAFWSIHDSLLYLDSVLVKSYSRSIEVPKGFPKKTGEDPRIVSVSIPPQEIVLNTSAEKRTFKQQKGEPLFADFVSDTIGFACGESKLYEFVVDKGRVSLIRDSLFWKRYYGNNLLYGYFDFQDYDKKTRYEKMPKLYRENATPFAAYYKVLDSLRQELDDVGNETILETFREDPRFKRFEDFFNIKSVASLSFVDTAFAVSVTMKGETPFKELVFHLEKYEKFYDDPIESVKLFLRTLIAIRKNPSFEKWLRYKNNLMNYTELTLVNHDSLGFFHPIPRDSAWKDVGMRGEYVSSLQYGDRYYEFALSDSGDVLVTNAWVSEGENFFNIEDDRPFVRGYKRQAEMSQWKNHFFNYIIIRNDGTVEIGPRSEWW